MQEPYAGEADAWHIVAVEPPHRLAFRWHPYAVEPGDREPEAPHHPGRSSRWPRPTAGCCCGSSNPDSTRFPRRGGSRHSTSNSEGWAHQAEMVRKYLALGEPV